MTKEAALRLIRDKHYCNMECRDCIGNVAYKGALLMGGAYRIAELCRPLVRKILIKRLIMGKNLTADLTEEEIND